MVGSVVIAMALATGPAGGDAELENKVAGIFEDECTGCHSEGGDPNEPDGLNLEILPSSLIGKSAVGMKKPLVKAGDPAGSYLLTKITGQGEFAGELMPSEDGLPSDQVKIISDWIASIPGGGADVPEPPANGGPPDEGGGTPEDTTPPDEGGADTVVKKKKGTKPFHGTSQILLPTTTSLGRNTLQYRIDHRFGRIGTERGFLGLDAGVVMSMGIAYGIFDGWDVGLRRTNSRKGWNLYSKYIVIRQEEDWPLSVGAYASLDFFRDFGDQRFDLGNNALTGNVLIMISRLWLERWSTMLTFGYHTGTNKTGRPQVDFGDGDGAVPVKDQRGTMTVGLASTVWLGKRKRWGVELEYVQPIPDGGKPNVFYYRGGDADPGGTPIGAWSLGGSYYTGKHFFQVFFTNNREIHMNLAAPGGQTTNPFATDGASGINNLNFFMGFNLGRRFTLGKNAKKWKKNREERKAKKEAGAGGGATDEGADAKADAKPDTKAAEPKKDASKASPPAPPADDKGKK